MKYGNITRCTLTACVVASLTACSGASVTPRLSQLAAPQAPDAARSRADSWMKPGANRQQLLYITRPYDGRVDVYTYPEDQAAGTLSGLSYPVGDCTDKKGNVYIVNFNGSTVVEYAHGGSQPIKTLSVPGIEPNACAVDRRSGDLAVTSAGSYSSGNGANVAIYRKAKGKPKTYTYAKIRGFTSCTYDDAGDLFVDGTPARGYGYNYELAELGRGAQSLQGVAVPYGIPWSAPLHWDAPYLAVGQDVLPAILRYTVSNGYATYVGSTKLSDAYDAVGFVIARKKAIVVNIYYVYFYVERWNVLVYNYPGGGFSTLNMLDTGSQVGGIALSR